MSSKLVVAGVGDGGCKAMLRYAQAFARRLNSFTQSGQEYFANMLRQAVTFAVLNTNKLSVEKHKKQVVALGLQVKTLQLGPKCTKGRGTGQDRILGLKAFRESLEDGSLPELFSDFRAAITTASLGEGGTGFCIFDLVQHLREVRRMLVFPFITTASLEVHEVDYAQAAVIKNELRRFTQAGWAYQQLSTKSLYSQGVTLDRVFPTLDGLQATSCIGLVRLLATLTDYDPNNLLRRLYWAEPGSSKRLLVAAGEFDVSRGNDTAAMHDIGKRLASASFMEFDRRNVGGGVVIFEQTGVDSTAFPAVMAGIMEAFAKAGRTKSHLHLKPITMPSGDPRTVTVTLAVSEYTGLPDVADLPDIDWGEEQSDDFGLEPLVAAGGVSAPEEILPDLLLVETRKKPRVLPTPEFTRSFETLEELCKSALNDEADARWIMTYGDPSALLRLIITDKTRRDRSLPLLCFDVQGGKFAMAVFESLGLLYRLKKQLPNESFSAVWHALLQTAVEQYLRQGNFRLVRYLYNGMGRVDEITPKVSPSWVEGHWRAREWKRTGNMNYELAMARAYVVAMFGEGVADGLTEPVDTRPRIQKIPGVQRISGWIAGTWRRRKTNGLPEPQLANPPASTGGTGEQPRAD